MSELNTTDLDTVRDAVAALKAIDSQMRALTETKTSLQNDIKEAMGAAEVGKLDGHTVVTWKYTKKPERFNVTAFRRDYPALAEQYTELNDAPRPFKVLG
ncbi:hypothetical protein [Gordonia insulae]|uniref:Uncharacterized protein n=1 Tax=Gordonia insulae TaxID=2420509 RepID=A0A3G8JEZ4_9ACTN|nr:hypothetical protein [Gordonia insulae]AZG43478.1 hypothetical protein D7316_00043 [Gordonia insulae]